MTTTDQRYNLASLWASEQTRFKDSRARITECGSWRRREVKPVIPPDWINPEAFQVMLPQATKMGQDLVNFLSRKRPAARRVPFGAGPTAESRAQTVETWLRAAMTQLRANGDDIWRTILAHCVNDAEFALLVLPRPAHYECVLQFRDDGEEGQSGAISARFAVDKKGRGPSDPYYTDNPSRAFNADEGMSAANYQAYARDAKAMKLPFVVDIVPADQCIPFGIGPDGSVEALLIQRQRTALSLKRAGLDWFTLGSETAAYETTTYASGTSALSGAGQVLTLYELWVPGRVVYQVTGPGGLGGEVAYDTWLSGTDSCELDLKALYDIDTLPGGYFYGAHFESERNPDRRGIPLLWPFLNLIRGANQTLSALVAHMYSMGFGGWIVEANAELLGTWIQHGKPMQIKVEPMKATVVPGKVVPAAHPGTGKDVNGFVQFTMGQLSEGEPAPGQPSSGQSGFGQSVAVSIDEASYTQILDGATDAYRCACENLLELAEKLSEKTGGPIPIYTDVDKDGSVHNTVEIGAEDLQSNWAVRIAFPNKSFSNLPLMQAGYAWTQGEEPAISHETWLRDFAGVEDPEAEINRVWVQKQLASPEGEAYVLNIAAKKQGNQELLTLAKLQQQGKASQGGFPQAALPPPPGQGQPTDASGLSLNPGAVNPAASALGGIMAGQTQTGPQAQVMAATGQGAPTQ